jgi:hypothetical protein
MEAVECSLRDFMQAILNQGSITLKTPSFVGALSKSTGLSKGKVHQYLDELDLKFIKVRWSNGGRPLALEILRYDVESIPEEEKIAPTSVVPKSETPKRPRGRPRIWHSIIEPKQPKLPNIRICAECTKEKRIVSNNRCSACCQRSRNRNLPRAICAGCNKNKKIFCKNLCFYCYNKSQRKIGTCSVCRNEKPIFAKGLCHICYEQNREKKRGICITCGDEYPLAAKGKCQKCYHRDYDKNRRQKADAEPLPICQPS